MGIVVPFPYQRFETNSQLTKDYRLDPYYQFIEQVLSVSKCFGFRTNQSIKLTARLVYHKTRNDSQLAKIITKK